LLVETVKVAVVAPAGTVTLVGMVATPCCCWRASRRCRRPRRPRLMITDLRAAAGGRDGRADSGRSPGAIRVILTYIH
jgi:hypothetical protein